MQRIQAQQSLASLPKRRAFILGAGSAFALGLAGLPRPTLAAQATQAAGFLPPLPYDLDALDPVLSANTLGYHYGKHHKAYADNTARLITGTPLEGQPLEQIVAATAGKADQVALFNNAAQTWNHTFYWQSLRPHGGGEPPAELRQRLESSFGSVANFKKELVAAATGQFGSGWAWLVADGDKLRVMKSGNAETPLTGKLRPLLAIDVWEHAYYLDYQNRRADYASALLDKLVDWNTVLHRLTL